MPIEVLHKFGLVYPAIAVMVLFALWVSWPYSMNRDRHAEIQQELAKRTLVDS